MQPALSHLSDAGLVLEGDPRPLWPAAAAPASAAPSANEATNQILDDDAADRAPSGADMPDVPEGAVPGNIRDVLMQLAGRGGAGSALDEEQLMEMLAR
jgi:hypothetical protein